MRATFFILILFTLTGCSNNKTLIDPNLSDLNLYITSDQQIDSVFISDIGQSREFYFIPFKDTLNIVLNDSINDLYNIDFYTPKGRITNQLWLDGSQVIIKAHIDKKMTIDTVINSTLYYESQNLQKETDFIYKERNNYVSIDSFFMGKIKTYANSPLSVHLVKRFFYRAQNDKTKLQTIAKLLANQSDNLKKHPLDHYKKLMQLINTTQVDLKTFNFYNIKGEKTKFNSTENGKLYLLDFWFVNCVPCVADHKIIASDLAFLETNNIDLWGISIDDDHDKWRSYLSDHHYEWPNYRQTEKDKLTQKMLISSYPTYLLVNAEGEINYRSNSYKDVVTFVNSN